VQEEFPDLAKNLSAVMDRGLLRVNGQPATLTRLKNMDEITRVLHWHEPPVVLPEKIEVEKISLPRIVIDTYGLDSADALTGSFDLYICNKPSTVPVHPAGPYLANTLTLMVEAQEGLEPRSLVPCHRIDRVTSGLMICCTNMGVARLLGEGSARKLYLARVKVSMFLHGKG
jgi:tRNA pseudouridine synthase 8/2,5-diamino-6-(5-phospho-D-ribitylamino)-pyrimidin-4(3H)-one deaminase